MARFNGVLVEQGQGGGTFGGIPVETEGPKSRSVIEIVKSGIGSIADDWNSGQAQQRTRDREAAYERGNEATQQMIERQQRVGTSGELDAMAAADQSRVQFQNAPAQVVMRGVDFARDQAVSGAQGAIGFGESAVGLGDLATDWTGITPGGALEKIGYDPQEAKAALGELKSDAGKARDAIYESTRGFTGTMLALQANPGLIADKISESLVGTVGAGAIGASVVRAALPKVAAAAEAAGLTGAAAEKFISDRIASIAIGASAGAEGAQGAGNLAETARQGGREWSQYVLPAIASGVGTAAIAAASGGVARKLGIGDIESDIAMRGAGKSLRTDSAFIGNRMAVEGFKEGVLEEMPQSVQEAAWENVAMGRPWDEGLGKAAATGLATGFGMGAGHATIGGRQETEQGGETPAPAPAARADEVLGAPTAKAPTEADKALYTPKSLTALDRVNEIDAKLPEAAPEEVAALQTERASITASWPKAVAGAATSFSTETGARLDGQYALMEADDLTTSHDEALRPSPTYPTELQPRQRERHASEMQIQQIVQRLDPARLGEAADAANGAPIVGADGLVESGNARTIALKRVHRANGLKADTYRQFIKDNAARFGLTPDQVDGMQKPVLVRVRSTPVNRAEFARQANASTVARMSPSEQAKSDAAQIDSLEDLRPDDNGDFMSGSSNSFVRRFMAKLAGTEQSGMVDAAGQLSQAGYARIRNAVLAKAYGDSPVLLRMVESLDDNTRNLTKALMRVAPQVAKVREAIGAGALFDADITPDLVAAVEELSRIKEAGGSVRDTLAQSGMFGDKMTPETRDLLTFLDENIRRPRRIADFIQAYMEALEAAGNPNQGSLLGDAAAPDKGELLTAAKKRGDDASTTQDAGRRQPGEGQKPGAESGRQPADAARGQGGNQGNEAEAAVSEWRLFGPETGSLGIPRAEMPQVKGDHRGALIQFLSGKGITHETVELPASELKPTQAEYSTEKVAKWAETREGVDRSVLASSDGYILDGHHQWMYALGAGEVEQVIRFSVPIRELLAATFQFPSVQRSEGANVVELRAKNQKDIKDALADLAEIATKHTRAAMLPENTPNLMPTLIKLSSAAIKEVGYQAKDIIARVKQLIKSNAEFGKVWNKIDAALYRKAALKAAEQESLQRVDDLFTMAEQSRGQQDLFGAPAAKPAPTVAMIDGRPYDMKRDNYRAKDAAAFIPGDLLTKARGLIDKYFKEKPKATISDEDRAKAEASLKPLLEKAEKDKVGFDQAIIDVAKSNGISQMVAPLKGIGRAAEKVVLDYVGDASQINDLLRATVIVSNYNDAAGVITELAKKFKVSKIKNKAGADLSGLSEGLRAIVKNQDRAAFGGYADVSLIVITESGLPAEVQINVPAMMAVKDAEGHKLYEAARAQSKDSQEEREIDSAMQRVYDVAFSFKEDTRRASLTQFKKLDSELDEPFDTGAPGSGTSSILSSSSLNQEPSGNSTNSSPLNDDMNRQPSGNLSGTFIASTPSDNSIAKGEPTSYTSIKEPGKGDANEQQRKDGAAGTQGQGAGSPQGTDGEREAQGVREGTRGGNRGTDDNAGASDGGQAGVRENRGSDGARPDNERSAADGQGGRAGRAVGVPAGRDIPAKSGQNYRFGDDDLTYEGGWLKKAAQNVEAVELAKKLQAEGRQATREEQAVLAKFIGWGASEIRNSIFGDKLDKEADAIRNYEAAKKAVDEAGGRMTRSDRGYMDGYSLLYSPGYGGFRYGDTITSDMIAKAKPPMGAKKWVDLRDRLKAALTPDEWATAERSTQYAHYTSKPVVQSMWKAVERMGFKGGAILEPGAGIGVFPGLMAPAMATNSVYTGIEYDALTGEILKQLFPDERILVESFVDSALPDNFYDMAIGNPPFADVKVLADPAYKKHAFSLHDYFFAKSIDKVKPGGLMIYVTSRYTMDKKTDKARAYLGGRADLIGAIRLPQTAFQKNAGTEVVTDVMFLRKKVPGEAQFPEAKAWLGVAEVQTDKGPALINEYFANHPEMVLGKHSLAGSMYSKNEYTVLPNEGDIEAQFAAAVENLPADIYQATGDSALAAKVREIDFNPKAQKEGNYYLSDAGVLMQREGGVGVRSDDKPAATVEIVKSFIKLRDALKQAHYDQLNNGAWEDSLAALQKEYRAFVKKHGNILQNKAFERATKRVDEETGEEVADTVTWRRFDLLNKINDDPDYTLVEALEVLNEETGEITESKFLTERVLAKQEPPRVVTPHDSLLSVLNDVGRVDMPLIAERLGITQDQAIEALGTAVYESPSSGWQMADEYLSGNVKKKLQEAKEAAKADRRFNRNVEALTSAQPSPVPPADITPALGMSWIPANVYEQFLQEKTGVKASVDFSPHTKKWTVTAQSGWQSARATVDWGTMDRNAADILDHALTGRPIRITRTQGKGDTKTTVFDAAATEAANQKLKQMRDAFAEWIWQDGARTDTLTRTYNDTFNTIVSRSFDGRHLTMPGASTTIKVFDHVKRGAWRIIQAGNSYLAHAVGSGKTWQMVISAMEQKRLGLINKPMMVVPNHMLQQFAREWQQLYPAARLMVADEKNFHTNNRRRFVSRVALSDLDGVIITHSAFKLLDLDPAFKRKMIEQELTLLRTALAEVEGEGERSPKVRDIQNRIEKMEQKLEAAMSSEGKDKNVRFDQLGVDMLYVDEAHEFRKLAFTTQRQVKGIDSSGSDRAFDLFMKTRWLEEKKPGRSLVMASGTPVTNTLAELYSVQRFMAPQVLEDRGIPDFDSWAAMFGQENTEIEADAAGKYSPVTRFTKFVNVPELTQMFREFADVLTSDHLAKMLGDKRPKVKDGSRKLEITPQTADYTTYKAELAARLEASRAWKPSPDEPNNPDPIIKIIGDGRLAAIDMRFIWPDLPSDPNSKLNKMLDGVIEVYKRTADIQYRAKSTEKDAEGNDIPGEIEPDLGGAQMVFSDLGFGAGVAQNRGFNARAWAEKRLRDAGIPAKHIAFMSDHKKSTAKLKLFQDVNAGRVRILFGSSKNMGTGVNAQQRLVALHHLDTPWYPADLEQREGRIIRQGNKNPNVEIYAYSTKGSYDTVMWQMLTSKQRFIDQALSGDSSVRSIDDLTEASQFQIATAMTAGDPRAIQLAGIKADIEKLQRLFRAHEETRAKLRRDYEMAGLFIESAKSQLPDAEKLAARVKDLSGENFTAKADGQSFGKRKEWGEAMLAMLKDFTARGKDGRIKAGELSGFPVEFVGEIKRDKSEKPIEYRTALVIMEGEDMHILARDPNDDPVGMSMRATNLVAGYARRPAELRQRIEDNTATRAALESRLGAKFQFANELSDKLKEAAALEQAMLKGDAKSLAFNRDEWANATTMFSRGTGRGMALRDLQAVADRVAQGMKNLPRVNVMESPTSLSTKDPAQKALRDYIRKAGAWDDVEGATHEGEIYLFASGLADETRAEHVLATHEVTHYGLRGVIGKDLDGALLHVLMTNAKVRKAAATKKASLGLASNLDAVEEVLADMPDTDLAKLSGWRRVVKVVRDWLNRSGMKSMVAKLDKWISSGLSDQAKADLFVADLVTAARNWVKRGKGKATVPGTMLAEQKLSDDWAAQEKWLSAEAKARGFKSIDELAEKDYPAFEKLAAKWREKNPVADALLSRKAGAIRNSQTANKPTADDIIAKPAGTTRPVDAVMRGITQAVRLDKLTTAIYNRAGFFLDRLTPETIKAGLVSDYGIPEAVTDMRAVIQGRQRQQTRAAGALLEKLATLTRAESRVAYEWMNTDNPQSSDWFMEQLPPESVKVLAEVEKMIDDLSKEAVALGQLDVDAYKRNRFAYLRRSYTKHEAELTKGEAAMRKRAIAILGDQYKGRGMTDSTPMKRVQNTAPEWWGRKTVAGKADKGLKGERFIRLEKRAPVGAGTAAVPGTGGKQVKPRLLEIAYWPASEPIPARYGSWDHAGTWEVRDTNGADLVLWRDFTKQEREAMGEIDEVRYAIAKTLHGMIHDVETGRYLQWLAQNHAKKPGETINGTVIEASDRMRDTFKPGEWVQVPETVIPGTRVKKYGTLAGRFLPGPIWNDVRQVVGFRYQPLGETYATIHRAWKTSKTALSPAVHMNNVMANFVMADWHDVTAGHVLKALKLMLSKDQAAAEVIARFSDSGGSIGTWAAKELQREQLQPIIEALEKELGLAGNVAGQVGVMSALQLMLKGSFPQAWDALKPSKPGKAAVAAGRALINLYEAEDQVFRLAAWLRAKEQGATDLEAGKAARKSFLDYSINAPWVQMMRSTLLPFVAFTYRSVPMALETAAKKPWKIMKLAMIAGAVNALGYMLSGGDEDDERKLLPEEKAGKIWGIVPKLVRMPWNDDNGSPVFLDIRRYVPVGDVFDVGQSHAAIPLLPSMTPGGPLMVMAELALDRTQFTGKQITKDTDSWDEQAAKVLDHLYKAFAPNIILLPGTYAFTGAVNAGSGKTDSFGREQSLTQAVVSSVGVKLGSYPKDVLRLNETRAAQAKLMEIDSNITQLGREYQRKGITREKFNQKVAVQAAKKKEVLDELGKKMAK